MKASNEGKLLEIIEAFDRAGFLKDVVLIGSWCLSFYSLLLPSFDPNVRTTDVDFYVPNSRTAHASCLVSALREIDYDHLQDSMTSKSRFVSPEGFEVEFLVKLNREGLSCVRLGNSGIYAESLSYLDIYSGNCVQLSWFGHCIKIASPSAFVMQKILIHDKRGSKAEKDADAIKNVLKSIVLSKEHTDKFLVLFNSLPKKWQRIIREYVLKENCPFPGRKQ